MLKKRIFYAVFLFQCDMPFVDFGTVVVGSTLTKQIEMINPGDCSIHYELDIQQKIEGPYPEEHTRYDPVGESNMTHLLLYANMYSCHETSRRTCCIIVYIMYMLSTYSFNFLRFNHSVFAF